MAIQKYGSDLVMMGVENYGGTKNFFLGLHVERAIRLTPCPFLAVKPPQAGFYVRMSSFHQTFQPMLTVSFRACNPC